MLNNTTIMGINGSYLDTLVTILSILGGVFGGIPAIIKWISRPRFCIKYFRLINDTIIFTIANEGLLSKDATELEIKCLLQNEDLENRIEKGLFSDDKKEFQDVEAYRPKIILMDGLPRGASTNYLFFRRLERSYLPNNFIFFIFLKYREGKAILSRKYSMKRLFLFCWDEVPGNDKSKLFGFITKEYSIFDWIQTAQIEKDDDDKRINISDGMNLLSLKLDIDRKEVKMTRNDRSDLKAQISVDYYTAKMEKGKLNIYKI